MTKKISIKSLYKIFGKDPKRAMEHVQHGIGKDQLLEKHNHVLGLSDINLDIEDKSIQVVMGLSGSGKSTLIRHINRLIEPTSGSVNVEDQEITGLNLQELRDFRRQKTAMVFQKFALLTHKTVLENVSFGLDIQKKDPSETKKKALKRYPQNMMKAMAYFEVFYLQKLKSKKSLSQLFIVARYHI